MNRDRELTQAEAETGPETAKPQEPSRLVLRKTTVKSLRAVVRSGVKTGFKAVAGITIMGGCNQTCYTNNDVFKT